jgi:O-antigen ligase
VDIWRANPLLGAGLGGYWFVSQGSAGYTTFHPHNQVLYVLAEDRRAAGVGLAGLGAAV